MAARVGAAWRGAIMALDCETRSGPVATLVNEDWLDRPMPDRVGHAGFIAALRLRFPTAAAEIDPDIEGGLLHLEMAAFTHHAEGCIRDGDATMVRECFLLADWLLQHGDDAVVNAVHVSFLEHLLFEDRKTAWAKSLMTPSLARAWEAIHDYMRQIGEARRPPGVRRQGPS